jgi:PPK2 family polyphosphate:nucleotide phosphotransferase
MATSQLKRLKKFLKPYRVTRGGKFRLRDFDPGDTHGFKSGDKGEAKELLQHGIDWLSEEQQKLYAQDRWGVLLVFQAMDAAGKDGTIKHVISGVDPQGVQVYSFKSPSNEDLDHDFMWRCARVAPERGRIGIFNRSYYEEVLVVRVHEDLLMRQKLPSSLVTRKIWNQRFEDIRAWESYLARNGYVILKFFLNVSKKEQKKRFLERLNLPEKNWKFSSADARERQYWDAYMKAYEDMIRNTASEHAPWYVVPADNKWFTRLVVAAAIVEALESLDLKFPVVDDAKKKELARARQLLMRERR